MATEVEQARGLIAAAYELLVKADAILDALAAGPAARVPQTGAEGEDGGCEHPKGKREDISGFGERAGSRFKCGVCTEEVAA